MRLLLDTHTLIWALSPPPVLPIAARRLIENPRNDVFVSSISLLEIAAKRRAGRRTAPGQEAVHVSQLAIAAGFSLVPLLPSHAVMVEQLAGDHRDPFDLALVAQAQIERMRLLTHDETLAGFGPLVILF